MEKIKDIIGLLMHQLHSLYATEEQQLQSLPAIIEQANHSSLKNALNHHLKLTKEHKARLEKIPELINEKIKAAGSSAEADIKPVSTEMNSAVQSKGMKGLLDEANDLLTSALSEDVTDAAIIAAIQKIEHYEICTYGTALAYAHQLHLRNVETILNETLNEEYDADDLLTALATASLNKEAAPEGFDLITKLREPQKDQDATEADDNDDTTDSGKVIINERTVNSPGGRAGTSHRRYPSGESRGH